MPSQKVPCGICSQRLGRDRQAICASCSRAALYPGRIEHVVGLIAREDIQQRVQTILKPPSQISSSEITTASQIVDVTEGARKLETQRRRAQLDAIDLRLQELKEHHDYIKSLIATTKDDIKQRRQNLAQRQKDLVYTTQNTLTDRRTQHEGLQAECTRLQSGLDRIQTRTSDGRLKLCGEVALLSGLSRRRLKSRDTAPQGRDLIYLGHLPVPDLRDFNTTHPDMINASMANVTRLLIITSHYLGLRLPAEIVVQHADFPRPVIHTLTGSYQPKDRDRLLAIPKPLPVLAKEDEKTFKLFVEGLVLLAYDIGWLCRMTGVGGVETFEDFCAIGSNLHRLLLGGMTRPRDDAQSNNSHSHYGRFSHASAISSAARTGAARLQREWTIPSLTAMQDRLRAHLLAEITGAEWEMLEEKEWEIEREDERAVLIGGPRWSLNSGGNARALDASFMTTGPGRDEQGAKGWTKVKPRSRAEAATSNMIAS